MNSEKPVYIDLFAGCGGLSLGLKNAGWEGIFAVEKNSDAFSTLKHNLLKTGNTHYNWPDWLEQKAMPLEELLENHGNELASLKNKVDLLAGGPPCQGFSTVGRRQANDPRNQIYKHYLEVVKIIEPRMVLLENVRGIKYGFKGLSRLKNNKSRPLVFSEIIEEELGKDYHIYPDIVEAKSFGVPQSRQRYILIGVRKDILKEKTDIDPFAVLKQNRAAFLKSKRLADQPISVSEAISDLQRVKDRTEPCTDTPRFDLGRYGEQTSGYQKQMHGSLNGQIADSHRFARHLPQTVEKFTWFIKNCPKGKKLSSDDRGDYANKKHTIHILHPDQIAPTVTTLPDDILHYSQPRILPFREMARLQSFPDHFEFKGKYTTGGDLRKKECPRYTQVGNAVPPLLAEGLGKMLSKVLMQSLKVAAVSHKI